MLQKQQKRVLTVTDLKPGEELRLGRKSRVAEDLDEVIDGLDFELRPGGGAQNGAQKWGIEAMWDDAVERLARSGAYVDLGHPTKDLLVELERSRIEGLFYGARQPSTHLVLNVRDTSKPESPMNYHIFKPEPLKLIETIDPSFSEQVQNAVQSRGFLLVNSPKDPIFAKIALQSAGNDIPVYANPTNSYPRDFGIAQVLPKATISLGSSDLSRYSERILNGSNESHSGEQMMDAVWHAMNVKDDRALFATFGEDGAMGQNMKRRYRVGISSSYRQEIQKHLKTALGAGDNFIVYVMDARARGHKGIDEILQYATHGVLAHLGIAHNLPSSAFQTERVF